MKAHVLMYHDVAGPDAAGGSGFSGAGADHYKLAPDSFREHLEALRAALPDRITTVQKLAPGPPPVLLTFDDGGASAYDVIAPELERRGLRGHFFVATDWLGRPGFMSRAQVVELARRGHVIGTHSASHPPRIDRLPDAELQREWRQSVQVLCDLLGAPVTCGSIPGGHYSQAVAHAAAGAGIRQLFTSEPTSRTWTVADCELFGRYAITRLTSAAAAAGYATGVAQHVLPQWTFWQLKKLGKQLAGPSYEAARSTVLSLEQKLRPSRRRA